ncbi:molybdate ABC transporter permease subunit [Paraneptunicella aestuarii]|uniref:molybdate ABC transporter permease subunit n=1 Tax=Paraneptunicella aestuarii TaxID=2831148 RepID=UPI001E38F883|nr:molybdate ABC transporter permease subunit [Paraneptunicella aestuarii]UAA40554.1 molybdate ABC transporter permease subunit [Paraneptunicella aestuarii]
MISEFDWQSIWLTAKLAGVSTFFLLLLGIPLAWWLARSRSNVKFILDAIITLPLVLPPTVLGYYLLVAMTPDAWLGKTWQTFFDSSLVFSFSGLVIGSILYSLPFVVQPIRDGFKSLDNQLLDVAQTMGANWWQRFRLIVLPLTRPMLITGTVLGFAHTVGEFGVVLLIGGNIPGETRVLSIALFDYVETMQLEQANQLAAGMLLFSFSVLLLVNWVNRK